MSYSPAQIIDEKGGPAAFATKVGKRPGAVRAWKHRNCLPRDAWPEIMQAFSDLTLEALIAAEALAQGRQPAKATSRISSGDAERAKPLRCLSTHGSAAFATGGQSR